MKQALTVLMFYLAAAAVLLSQDPGLETQESLPPLPAEAAIAAVPRSVCRSPQFEAAFRWTVKERPVFRRGLAVACDEGGGEVAVMVSAGKTTDRSVYRVVPGPESSEATAAVIARLLPLRPSVIAAAEDAFFWNQADAARAGADLWRARRWKEAAEQLSGALENEWDDEAQASLHFGLADAHAHLGKPRQAFWHALCYLGLSSNEPSEAWLKSLRGAAGLLASQPQNVEPEAEALARRWRQAVAARRWDVALDALKRLSAAAPWSHEYQDRVAEIYARLGWSRFADSWRRRAALTRRLASDAALQRRAAEALR